MESQAWVVRHVSHPLDNIAAVLEGTGDYRVLRRLEPLADRPEAPDEPTFVGLVVDVETTGTDFAADEVIELGILKFEYGLSGRIYRVLDTLNQLHQPLKPIPSEIARLTGISDADVAGQQIDDAAVARIAADAAVGDRAQRQLRPANVRAALAGVPGEKLGLLLSPDPLAG